MAFEPTVELGSDWWFEVRKPVIAPNLHGAKHCEYGMFSQHICVPVRLLLSLSGRFH
jgi:hypothetical protein